VSALDLPAVLFRGLSEAEVQAGCIPLPKRRQPFLAHPRLPIKLPFVLGERIEHAVREHQWSGKYPTSGISTSPIFERACFYGSQTRVVVEIDTARCGELGIAAYKVSDYVDDEFIICPEDQEVILCYSEGQPLPQQVILRSHRL
jgi:hypothetical protein